MKITELLNAEMFKVTGWSIIHSMWQFLLLFAVLKGALLLVSKRRSKLRYIISLIFLASAVTCSFFTFYHEYQLFFGNKTQSVGFVVHPEKAISPVNPPVAGHAGIVVLSSPAIILFNFLNSVSSYLTIGWIIGMIFFLFKISYAGFYLNTLRKLPSESFPDVNKKIRELCGKMKIGRNIRLIITGSVSEALTFGHFKPVILLPLSYVTQVSMEQMEMIIAHELAHIKRFDYAVNLLQATLEAVYFFNPFFSAMSDIVRNEREYCCDDMAVATCGDNKTLAIALASLKLITTYPELALPAAPKKSIFQERIHRLIGTPGKSNKSVRNSFFSALLILLTLALLSKSVDAHINNKDLPVVTDPMVQLLTDNQANYKEQLFSYKRGIQVHEIFLISTVNGKPLYAYLDGALMSKGELFQLTAIMNQQRTITPAEIAKTQKSPVLNRQDRHSQIHNKTESLMAEIKRIKSDLNVHPSREAENKLKELSNQVNALNKEEVTLSMEQYREDVKQIPVDVKLHELLTKIIVNKEYTPEERKQLNVLVKKKAEI
ncbi:MAG: bla regulator protein blaR1 [Mucilaginibacter sp.]|nr:bla regulator protein blaR1 [Mucilaginibacter sp.]